MGNLWSKIHGHSECLQNFKLMIENRRWPHASIFCGPMGVGKFLSARAVAQNLICATQKACGRCGPCLRVDVEQSESLLVIQPETAQIKVGQTREVLRFMYLKSLGPARVVIVNEAHRLNPQAANILLKTLEEPPEGSYLILVTSTLSGVLPTIRSRSQIMRFSTLEPNELGKVVAAPEWALRVGRVDLVNELLNLDEESTKDRTYGVWTLLLDGNVDEAFKKIKDKAKDREESCRVIWLWQQMLKAAWTRKVGKILRPWEGKVIERLSELDEDQLSGMVLGVVQLEKDMRAQLERSLCFENYFYKVDDFVQGRGGELL